MKRRKDDEKSMGPMFPRLHVNDTEKGGLRAPPRNKMALYEQLSIPSQRFNPLKPNSNNHVPPPSSSQVSGSDRNAFIPLQLTPSAPTFQFEKLNAPESGRARAVTSLARSGSAEDDFAVPVFIQSTAVHGKSTNKKSGEKLTNTDSNCTVQSKRIQRANGNDPKDNSSNVDLRQDVRSQTAIEPKESASSSGVGENSPKNLPDVGGFGKSFAEIEKSKRAARLQSENVARDYGLQVTLTLKNIEVDPPSIPRDPSSGDIQCVDDGEFVSDERSNDGSASDASIVDPVSTMDISPDDVVGIIGQKHFWKARKAIVNQQRVFAVQVFELHRLIKVQKLIAGSPHLMLEDSSAASKPSSIATFPAEKVALDMVVNVDSPSPTIVKHQDHEPAKQSHPECSAEKAVGKPVVASSRNATPGTAAPDTWTGPWGGGGGGPGPGPNQWMVPMMSPTEGLVYKPCPGPVYRSCGSSALMGSFPNPAFAYPHHQPLFPGFPHAGHNNNYFPSYGMMPMMSVPVSRQGSEAMNLEHVSCVRTGDVDTNHRSSSFAADFQGSTPSSPIKNAKRSLENRAVVSAQQKNQSSCNSELNHPGEGSVGFRSVHVEADGDQQPRRRVIKAVPHNRRSASESVARIFRSIQEERKR